MKEEIDRKHARRAAATTVVILMISLLSLNYISNLDSSTGMFIGAPSIQPITIILTLIVIVSMILFYNNLTHKKIK